MSANPRISLVVPYYRGIEHLPALLQSVEAQALPLEQLELVLVMNSQDDGARALIAERHPWVRVVDSGSNLGYGGGCNFGAQAALAPWVLLLNTDMRLDPACLIELLGATEQYADGVCFGSAILSWNGKRIDFSGGAMNFLGVGYQPDHGGPASWLPREDSVQLFVCGGAVMVRRDVYLEVGGFDEDFWAYYEDVDLGWRLTVLGHDVRLIPSSRVYHQHHGAFSRVGQQRTRVLYERNPLLAVMKNYDDDTLAAVLPVALMLAGKRASLATGVPQEAFRIGRTPPSAVVRAPGGGTWGWRYYLSEGVRTLRQEGLSPLVRKGWAEMGRRLSFGAAAPYGPPAEAKVSAPEGMVVPELSIAHVLALADVADLYPTMLEKRRWIQAHRRRSDREVAQRFRLTYAHSFHDARYHKAAVAAIRASRIPELLGQPFPDDA